MTFLNEGLQWIAILVLAVVVLGGLNLITDVKRRLGPDTGAAVPHDGLEKGIPAPSFTATNQRDGRTVSLDDFGQAPLLLAFLSPTCRPCAELVPDLNRFARENRRVPVLVIAINGIGTDYGRELNQQITVLSDPDGRIQQAYEVGRTPLTYLLDEERKVANRTISNSLLDLEDTLAGLGRPVGASSWEPVGDSSRDEDTRDDPKS